MIPIVVACTAVVAVASTALLPAFPVIADPVSLSTTSGGEPRPLSPEPGQRAEETFVSAPAARAAGVAVASESPVTSPISSSTAVATSQTLLAGVRRAVGRFGKGPRPFALRAPATSVGQTLGLTQLPWWGGPAYYARFPKAAEAGWTKDSFFPIAVFYGKPEHARTLASLGVNTYMGAEHDGSPISSITGTGISVIAQDEWTPSEIGSDPRVVGWHISDECDQGEGECWLDGDEYSRVTKQQGYAAAARSHSDGRFVQANFGNGVLGSWWATNTMAQHVALADVTSVDKYAYTSPGVRYVVTHSPYWTGRDPKAAGTYGWLQDRMESYSSPTAAKPNWVFIETARPFLNEDGAGTIAPAQISGAAWNAIIHGAAGISYFQHNNNGCGIYSLVQCSGSLQPSVRQLNAEISALAPVINTPSSAWSFGSGLDTALKVKDGTAYILSMTTGGTGQRTFTLPPGVRGTAVTVIGENRTIPVVDGRFTDSFASESTHHNYAVPLGG